MSVLTDPVLLGRGALLAELCDRITAGRHTLLVGPSGAGKSRLLVRLADLAGGAAHPLDADERRLARRASAQLPGGVVALYAPDVTPAGRCLDGLAEALHARGLLALAGVPAEFRREACAATPWARVRKTLPTVDAKEAVVLASLEEPDEGVGRFVLLLDGLDRATASGARLLARMQRAAVIVGAARSVPAAGALRTFFLTCSTVPVPPLPEPRVRQLAAYLILAHGVHAADARHLTREVVRRADGNPAAVRAMLHDAAAERLVTDQSVRDLQARDDAGYFNMGLVYAPLLVAGTLARVLMGGGSDTDLYVVLTLLTVAGYLVLRLFRPFFSWQPTPETR